MFDKSDSYDLLQQQEENMGTWHSSGKVLRSTSRINEYGLTYGYYRLYNEWNSRYSIVSGIDFKQTKSQLFFIRLNICKLYAVLLHILHLLGISYYLMPELI